ncbi:MAG: MMPL family transporter [Bacteroidota bacterium]
MSFLLRFGPLRPYLTLIALFIVTLVLGFGIRQLQVRNSFAGELPPSDPINQQLDRVKAQFGERSVVLIGLETDNIYTTATAEKIIQLSTALQDVPYVLADEVLSLATVQNVRQREWGLSTQSFLEEIPTTPAAWQQLRTDVNANAIVRDKLASTDGTLAVIAAALADDFEGGVVYDSLQVLTANLPGPERIHLSGAPLLVEDVQRGISGDSRRFIAIALVLIFIGFFGCFRRLGGVLLPVSMVILSIVWTMGAMGYLGLPVTVVSNALPVIMVAVASSYGIHFMHAYYSLSGSFASQKERAFAVLDKIGKPILITGVTSALGSLSLIIFKVTSLREFCFIGGLGFFFATLICLTYLPALCSLLKAPRPFAQQPNRLQLWLAQLTVSARKNRRVVLGTYLLLLPICLYLSSQIIVGDDYIKFFPQGHSGRVAAETFNDKLAGVRVLDVMVDATAYGDLKSANFYTDLSRFQTHLAQQDGVGSVHSYLNVIDHLRTEMDAENTNPLTSEGIAQYLMLHEMSATPGEVFALRTDDYQYAKLQVFLQSSNPEDHEALYEQLLADQAQFFSADDVLTFGGDVMQRIALGSYIVQGKIQNILLALLIVCLCCLLIFRAWRKALLTLVPITASLIMVFGLMGLIGIRLGISTALLTAMIVGIGIDFAVHYLVAFFGQSTSADEAIRRTSTQTGRAITYDAVSNILGFSVLSFSGFLPVQHFGWLLAFSMLLIFVNTLVLYPVLLGRKAKQEQKKLAVA